MERNKYKFIDITGTILVSLGIIGIFISIWSNGYYILRILITSVLLVVWGRSLWNKYEEKCKNKKDEV